tara:strand:+ start:1106 stop:1384 length:279 start_codon:yes stop_codon:yes gene_type:complete
MKTFNQLFEEKPVAEWEDVRADSSFGGDGLLSVYKRRGKYECEWNDNDEDQWLSMNGLDEPMSLKDVIKALKDLDLGKPDDVYDKSFARHFR